MSSAVRKSCFNLLLVVLGSVLLFDVGCFFWLPEEFSGRIFLGYRVGLLPDGTFGRGYPDHYYEAHPERGFDIGVNKPRRLHHIFNYPANYSYPIWSNSLGCFDHEHENLNRYIYLAGDSSVWGYTAFEKKFGTLMERRLGVPVLKCGVTHSGQAHQLSKMRHIVERIGAPPSLIVVVWSPNDVVNDAFFPHSTEINGWLVDTVHLSRDRGVVRESLSDLTTRVREQEEVLRSELKDVRWLLVKYSATYNVLIRVLNHTAFGGWLARGMFDDPNRGSIYASQEYPPRSSKLSYREDPLAKQNQETLTRMKAYADSIGSPLVVVLLALKPNHNVEVREFLKEKDIRFLDLGESTFSFDDTRLTWRIDPHPNEQGNAVIADAISAYIVEQRLLEPSARP